MGMIREWMGMIREWIGKLFKKNTTDLEDRVYAGVSDLPLDSPNATDQSTGNDDFEKYVNGLTEFIQRCHTPMTIAIQGEWGSGKTSAMNMIKQKLEKSKPFGCKCIWFNTWEISQFGLADDLQINIMEKFMDSFDTSSPNMKRVRKWFRRLKMSASVDFNPLGANVQIKNEKRTSDKELSLRAEIKKSIEKSFDKGTRVVFFIDDLDRIAPERAIEVLETIKLFMENEKCVFVLAIDYEIIKLGVQRKYHTEMKENKISQYFGKFIQLPVNLSKCDMSVILESSPEIKESGINIKHFKDVISKINDCNPRELKRILNAFALQRIIMDKEDGKEKDGTDKNKEERQRRDFLLFLVLCMQFFNKALYGSMEGNAAEDNAAEDKTEKSHLKSFFSVELVTEMTKGSFEEHFYNVCMGKMKFRICKKKKIT